ncbi:MAG TPA: hypothetical protein VH619_20580 [Verrucomicrobiae bacterium]|nr:hypothetical protein [Verrucomicrobiae bacterium]
MKSFESTILNAAGAGRRKYTAICAISVFCCCLMSISATAQIARTWTGTDSGYWGDPNNWNPYGVPQTGDYLVFGGNDSNDTMTNDITGLSVDGLSFGEVSYVLKGNPLTIDNQINGLSGIFGAIDTEANGNDDTSTTTTIYCALVFTKSAVIVAASIAGTITESTRDLYLNGAIQINESCLLTLESLAISYEGGGNSHLIVSGAISGAGSVLASADDEGGHVSPVEFSGSSPNSFLGTLYLSTIGSSSVIFDNSAGSVVSTSLAVTNGETANLVLDSASQIGGNTTVIIANGSKLSLSGSSPTVGTIAMTNVSADALPCTLDTGSTLLG